MVQPRSTLDINTNINTGTTYAFSNPIQINPENTVANTLKRNAVTNMDVLGFKHITVRPTYNSRDTNGARRSIVMIGRRHFDPQKI